MLLPESDYQPIDCEAHDRLLAWATLGQRCQVIYRDATGARFQVHDRILDVYTEGRAEYLRLSQGTIVRLDQLIQVETYRFGEDDQ